MHLVCALWLSLLAGETPVKIEFHERLDTTARMPVVFSADGQWLLFFKRSAKEEDGISQLTFTYCLAKADGSASRALYTTPVDWDDYLNIVLANNSFSADGKRIAVATTDSGRGLRGESPGQVVPGILSLDDGRVTKVACELGATSGFDFAGDDFVFLDTTGINSGQGYRLKILKGDKTILLDDSKDRTAGNLQVSPDGTRAAFFTSIHPRSEHLTLRVVDLQTGKTHDSPEFRSQDVTFDGRVQIFWDAASEGAFVHVCTDKESKWPFELTYYNFATGKGTIATPERNLGATCVLDKNYLVVWHPDVGGCSLLNIGKKTLLPLPDQNYILGGRGNRVVIADLDRDAVYAAELQLPAE